MMKRLMPLLLLPMLAWGQVTPVIPNNTVLGNTSGGTAAPSALTALPPLVGTNGSIIPNVDCTGTIEGTAGLQAAINTAVAQSNSAGGNVFIPANCKIRIATSPVYLYGTVSINCANNSTSMFYIDTASGALPNFNNIVFAAGTPSYGAAFNQWTGEFNNCNFTTSANAWFARAIEIVAGNRAGVRNSIFNFTTNGWIATPTITGFSLTGTAGQFSGTCSGVAASQTLTISGTWGGGGSITSPAYSNPTTYYISSISTANGACTGQLQTAAQGAIVSTSGTPTGLTFVDANPPLGGFMTTGTNATWTTGATPLTNFVDLYFIDSKGDETDNANGSEGVSCNVTNGFTVRGSHVYVSADDPIASHGCVSVWIDSNNVSSIHGRIYLGWTQNAWVLNNQIQHSMNPVTGLWMGTFGIVAQMDGVASTAQANANINVIGNTITCSAVLDSGSNPEDCLSWLYFIGVQDGLTVRDNILQANSNYSSQVSGIRIMPNYQASWTGPAGNPDYSNGGHIKVRNVTITNNKVVGIGTQLLGIDQGLDVTSTVAADFIGPIYVDTNVADAYNWPYPNGIVQFTGTNLSRSGSGAVFQNIAGQDVLRNKSFDFQFSGLTSGYTYLAPFGPIYSLGSTGSAGVGSPFIADRAGRVMAVEFSVSATPTSSSGFNLVVFDNGVIMTGSPWGAQSTNNATHYIFDYNSTAGMTFAAGDALSIYLGNASNTVVESGVARLIVQYAN